MMGWQAWSWSEVSTQQSCQLSQIPFYSPQISDWLSSLVCMCFSCRSLVWRALILLSSIWVSTIKTIYWLFMSQHHSRDLWRTTPRPLKTEMCRAPRQRSLPRTSVTEEGSYRAFCIVPYHRACFPSQFCQFPVSEELMVSIPWVCSPGDWQQLAQSPRAWGLPTHFSGLPWEARCFGGPPLRLD